MKAFRLRVGDDRREVRLEAGAARVGERRVDFQARDRDGRLVEILIEGRTHRVAVARDGDRIFVWCDGAAHVFERDRPQRESTGGERAGDLISPMPGRVRQTLVRAGDAVSRGQVLLVLEAMKMEHAIRAPRDGVVRALLVKEGDLVDAGVELARMATPA